MSKVRYWADAMEPPPLENVVLAACHAQVWEYREELAEVWPTPGRVDSLRFAVTEAAEALDAWLRTNPTYARNRAREMEELDELADCAMMLLTALGPEPKPMAEKMNYCWPGLERMVCWCAEALDSSCWGGGAVDASKDEWLWALVAMIAYREGMDLPGRLRARLERIKAKRLGEVGDGLVDRAD